VSSSRKIEPRIRDWAEDDFGVTLDSTEVVVGGLDPDALVWRAVDADGLEWAVKWTARDNRYGLELARALGDAGTPGVPAPRVARDGSSWSDRAGGQLTVTRWIGGLDAFETGLDSAEWRAFGALLRSVHESGVAAPVARTGRRGIRRAGTHVRRRITQIDDLAAAGQGRPDPEADRFTREWPAIRRRIVEMQRAAAELKDTRSATRRVSCHGDPHLGNVIVDESGQPWLIDFDDAVEAPREVDLMLIELGVLFTQPIADADRTAFRSGYGDVEVDEERIIRFGCVRAVEDLVETAHELLTGETDTPPAELLALVDGILSPNGLAGLVEERLSRGSMPD
jgi:spectinomycin phosphotransferase